MKLQILTTAGSSGRDAEVGAETDYELLDSGAGEKLERYGSVVLARPDPQALWPKRLSANEWAKADGVFAASGSGAGSTSSTTRLWHFKSATGERQWPIGFAGLKFLIKPSAFKHTGLFPEQRENWLWMADCIAQAKARVKENNKTVAAKDRQSAPISVLNLFGYTGGATLACAAAGAEVVHLDASKSTIGWARENAALSGLTDAPIRWILDDARSFVRRELKRGHRYDGIILDPPAFGRGPKGEVWKIEDDFESLLALCRQALSPDPLFFLVNGYATGYSAVSYYNALAAIFGEEGLEAGELAIAESPIEGFEGSRLLPAGIFARWSA